MRRLNLWKSCRPRIFLHADEKFAAKALDSHTNISKDFDMNRDYSRAIPEGWREMAAVFVALGDEHRQRILLTFEPGERLNVGQIAEVSTLARSTVSHHLKILRQAGVLESEKVGKEIYFWINKPLIRTVFANVTDYINQFS